MAKPVKVLTPLERRIMRVLWDDGADAGGVVDAAAG